MGALGLVSDQEIYGKNGRHVSSLKSRCGNDQDFIKYANDNMKALGLTPIQNIGDSVDQALARLGSMAAAIQVLGKGATTTELLLATNLGEKILAGAALYASFYVGAYIGSFAVATGKTLSCGSSIADALAFIEDNNIDYRMPKVFFANNPEILNTGMANREAFAKRASVS